MTKNSTTTKLEVALFAVLAFIVGVFAMDNPVTQQVALEPQAVASTTIPANTTLPVQEATVIPPTQHIAKAVLKPKLIPASYATYAAPHYKSLPNPSTEQGWDSHKLLIVTAAKYANADPEIVAVITAIETEFISNAANPRSTAKGLCQFTEGTWVAMARKYGDKYGITPHTSRLDARANAIMCAEYLNENQHYLETMLNRKVQPTELYMAHLLGAGGALSIIKARSTALAINVRPDAAASNKNLFYAKIGKNSYKARTVYEFKQNLRNKVKVQRELYGESAIAYSELLHGNSGATPIAINYQVVSDHRS